MRDALANEARAQSINLGTEDAPIALRAFLNKTEPEFTGRWSVSLGDRDESGPSQ